MTTEKVLNDVATERARQDSKWAGVFNDDEWNAYDWHAMISDYNAWARRMMAQQSPGKARNRYIQIASLAVAAVESLDRKYAKEDIARTS